MSMNVQPSWRLELKNGAVSLNQVQALKLDAYMTGPTSASLPSKTMVTCMSCNTGISVLVLKFYAQYYNADQLTFHVGGGAVELSYCRKQ